MRPRSRRREDARPGLVGCLARDERRNRAFRLQSAGPPCAEAGSGRAPPLLPLSDDSLKNGGPPWPTPTSSISTASRPPVRPRTISKPSGCRSRRTAPSRSARASSRAPRTCTTTRRRAGRSSTAPPGLWCCNAGHNRDPIVEAIQAAGRPSSTTRRRSSSAIRKPSSSRARIAALAPGDLDHVFFCNSGSEAVDTALKIALAYPTSRGQGAAHAADRPRARLSRRRLRRHLGRRHRRQPQVLRPAARRRRPPAAHLQPRASRPSPRASRNGARISPTSSSASSRCTTPRPSRP